MCRRRADVFWWAVHVPILGPPVQPILEYSVKFKNLSHITCMTKKRTWTNTGICATYLSHQDRYMLVLYGTKCFKIKVLFFVENYLKDFFAKRV